MPVTDHPTEPIAPTDTDRIRVWGPAGVSVPAHTGYLHTRTLDDPIPEVGDYWGLAHASSVPSVAIPPRAVAHPRQRAQVSGAASAALASALAAVPLSIVGIGAVLGLVAIVLGVVGIRQVAREPMYRGNGRAITAIVLGTGSVLVGTPILLLFMGLAALL